MAETDPAAQNNPNMPGNSGDTLANPVEGSFDVPRSDLRAILEDYNKNRPLTADRVELEVMEEMALTGHGGDLQDYLKGLRNKSSEAYDMIENYHSGLTAAIEDESRRNDVSNYLSEDLTFRREELARQAGAGMNKTFGGGSKKYAAAKSVYDESFRTFTRWSMVNIEEARAVKAEELHNQGASEEDKKNAEDAYKNARLETATELYVDELEKLREAATNEPELGQEKGLLKRKAREYADKEWEFGKKKFGKNKGEKYKISAGKLALFMATGAGGAVARGVAGASNIASFGATTAVAGGIGAIIGGLRSGYVAHRNTKGVLAEASDDEKETVRQRLSESKNPEFAIDKAPSSAFISEVDKVRRGRLWKIGKAAAVGAGIGLVTGASGGALGWGIAALPDLIGKIPWSSAPDVSATGPLGGEDVSAEADAANIEGVDAETENQEANAGDQDTSGSEETGGDSNNESNDDVPPAEEETGQAETAPIDELLEHYAENPVTIEPGEGPYATMEKLGITDPDMKAALYDNPDVKAALMERGLIYDVGDGSGDWGWATTGELSADDVRSIFENANLESVSSPEINIPASYDADLRIVAEQYPAVTNITEGTGGYELMKNLNLPPEAWDGIELKNSADFYRMDDGHMGLRHTGALSPEGLRELMTALENNGHPLYVTAA